MGVRRSTAKCAGGPGGRHRHPSRLPGQGRLRRPHRARPRRRPRRGCGLRVQHAERPEPARLPQDGMAAGAPAAGPGPAPVAGRDGPDGRRPDPGRQVVGAGDGRAAQRATTEPGGRRPLLAPGDSGVHTHVSAAYLAWRYGFAPLHYRVVAGPGQGDGMVVVRVRRRGPASEVAVCEELVPDRDARITRRLLRQALAGSRADHAVRLGDHLPRAGCIRLPARARCWSAATSAPHHPWPARPGTSPWAMSSCFEGSR